MQPLFSIAGRRRLDQIVQPGVLCVFDFDGTLSPITPLPDDAQLPDEVFQRLLSLSQIAPVGVLTGRSLEDIRHRLGFDPHYLVGNHGMQGLPGWENDSATYYALCRDWVSQLTAGLPADTGVFIEDKTYSLSLHYRSARDPVVAAAQLRELVDLLDPPPRIVDGKFVLNLLPQGAPDKGLALERLIALSACSTVLYVGDDVTDEDAFRINHPGLLSVRIEPHQQSAAEFYLPRRHDIVHLLDNLIERLCADTVGGHACMVQRAGNE
ncbi:trehalose-phosphatase [Lacisediminimonas sp.]|uniref:trehalose-phosphatase n=1 Tax=Lacisediminimonas sp. TaxID=3060582 RepID=UPI0027284B58|nr:trehalose-phosphatase [Lacisediminimonas sp.]MDO8299750.1 trehalose-phosphatase [Lacisediminimonas sp.]MDO9219191.1 trehalose-phosphatase [Lacisediminimonas sp.]